MDSRLDPLQYAYRQGPSTEDVVASVTHLISKHLENPNPYAQVIFVDFSSAFNTIQPYLLVQMLNDMHAIPFIINLFNSLLTNKAV